MRLRRSALVLSIAAATAIGGLPALASSPPSSGTISPSPNADTVTANWTGTVAGANANSDCTQSVSDAANDHHTFTLAVPAGFYDTHKVTMVVAETATGADTILTLARGTVLGSSDNGSAAAAESITLVNPPAGTYDAITCSFAGASPYTGSVKLTTSAPSVVTTVGGTSTTAAAATYGNYSLAKVPGAENSGEPSIGVDWATGNVYFQANLNTIKAQFPSYGAEPTLTDVSCLATTANTLDPIMYTDPETGRVGVSQLAANPAAFNSITNFFDSTPNPTGPQATCMPSQGGGEVAGPDHQTLGGGVYPTPLPTGVVQTTPYKHTFYYCSQTLVAGALCSRSDDGGTTFKNGLPPYTTECGGLHGHVRVGPEGNVYLPNKSCNGTQGLAVSTDAGQNWSLKPVTGTTPSDGSDPSVSADRAGTVYFASVNSDGKPEVSVSDTKGNTWKAPIGIGDSLGIIKAVYPEVIAGDAGRATVAFVGSTTPGDRNVDAYGKSKDGTTYTGGKFDMYTSTTVDGGATWFTQDITPNDPVQRGQICTNGTTCSAGRNLLDFNDIAVDNSGHVVIAYSDGCTAACVTSKSVADNKQTSVGVIGRQLDGPLLFVPHYHPLTPARLMDTRDTHTPVKAGSDRMVPVTGVGGVPATGVSAVVVNATVPAAPASGYLEVYPAGSRPATATSNVNWRPNRIAANAVTVKVGTGGKIGLRVNSGAADVALDVVGWYGEPNDRTGSLYQPLTPTRVLDTRVAGGSVTPKADRILKVTGGKVPATASGIVMTLTAVDATMPAYIEAYPTGSRPARATSNTNVIRGQIAAALVTSRIGTGGSVSLRVSAGSVDFAADILGYYSASGHQYVPLAPRRIASTSVPAGADKTVVVGGLNGVPTNATGVVVNVTGVNASRNLDIQVYPTGAKPAVRTSVLNLQDSYPVADLMVVPLGVNNHAISISASTGSADVLFDVLGYFTP